MNTSRKKTTRKRHKEIFDKIFNKYLKNKGVTNTYGSLAYFYQFLDIHKDNIKRGGYRKLQKHFTRWEEGDEELIKLLGSYGNYLIFQLEKREGKTDINIIEYKIALDKLSDFILELGRVAKNKADFHKNS